MKNKSTIRNIPYLTIILLTLICILLLSSKNMIMSQASYPEATIVSSAYAVVEGSDSDKEEITFPHTFKHLSPLPLVSFLFYLPARDLRLYGVSLLKSLGKRVVSRTLSSPRSCIVRRSIPIPRPPCGGIPCLNVSR